MLVLSVTTNTQFTQRHITPPRLSTDICDTILDLVDFRDTVQLRATGREGDQLFTCHMNNRYNALLGRFVTKTAALRAVLELTDSLVSGSVALAFFLRDKGWCPHDLDIFVPYGHYLRVVNYLIAVEGYSIATTSLTDYNFAEAVTHRTRLHRPGAVIDVLRCTSAFAVAAVPSFWSSHLMNFLSADSFGCAYPTLTFMRRGVLHPERLIEYRHVTPDIVRAMITYRLRAFDFRLNEVAWEREHNMNADCVRSASCPSSIRFFGDRDSIVGSFAPLGSAARERVRSGLPGEVTVVWGRGGDPCGESCAADGFLEPTRLLVGLETMLG
ncbi:hypothetical protein B0H21DRAFT_700968 [Amylocystis lapponica]|nr:hypothetical protein B0H21DRAFT_700968 [Amylocystis lapponica]